MKYLIKAAMLIFLIACESTSENEEGNKKPVIVSENLIGYTSLNQGSISSIDYYNIAADSLEKGVYQSQNDAETLSGYAEKMIYTEKYLIVSMQGDYGTGTNGKVIFLDHGFNNIGEVTSFPAGYNTINILFENDVLYVTYRKGNFPNADVYKLRSYSITEVDSVVTGSQIGSDYNMNVASYGYGSIVKVGTDLVSFDENLLEFIDASNLTLSDTIRFAESLNYSLVQDEKLYIGFTDVESGKIVATRKGTVAPSGGVFVLENGVVTDTIKTSFGVDNLVQGNSRLFAIYGRSIAEIANDTISKLFEHNSLDNLSSSYLHVNFNYTNNTFYIPDGSFVDGTLDIVDFSGAVLKTITHKGQVTAALPVKF